jgi:hypothetical protein
MWLTYGVDDHHALVAIADVPRGKTPLRCPYCNGPLTAKKGHVRQHHFAHTGETCRAVARETDLPLLPLYDNFNLHLSGKELHDLHHYWQDYGVHGWSVPLRSDTHALVRREILVWNRWRDRGRGGYEFTKLGKIPVGALSLQLFTAVQEPLIAARLAALEERATRSWERGLPTCAQDLTDFRLYRAQLQRILTVSLYFVAVQAGDAVYYKIGVTSRPIAERVAEIAHELRPQCPTVTLTVLGTWPHRGNVERYFKHRYQAAQHRIGTRTEYFQFADVRPVLRDLRRMPPKALSAVEHEILTGVPSALERRIADVAARQVAQARAAHRSRAIQQGMQQAAATGIHVGRPKGTVEPPDVFLAKPTSLRIAVALHQGLSVRQAAAVVGVSVNTVRKVAARLKPAAQARA